jgi:hypothetical protein
MTYVPDDLEIALAKREDPELELLWQDYRQAREELLGDRGVESARPRERSVEEWAKARKTYDDAYDRLVKYCRSRGLNDLTSLHL